jgi:hypothetical protein
MTKLIIAPNQINLDNMDAPLIFLAGPIQGAEDWQTKAVEIIESVDDQVYIASPRRKETHQGDFPTEMYNEQVDWETKHLRIAGHVGSILFWLAKEKEHNCERAYAQTTRFELAEWKVHNKLRGSELSLGIEKGFTGSKYIKRRFEQDCSGINIFDNLEDTCKEAVRLAFLKYNQRHPRELI